jgi:polysaccharide export outer membrane protein
MSRVCFRLAALVCVALGLAACAKDRPGIVSRGGPTSEVPYSLGPGDKLRITVFNQPTLSSTYAVDASGNVTMPLIGAVPAARTSPAELKRVIEARLGKDYLREPNVSVEVEGYRPFFIFGEVNQAGQYAYVAGMTAEQAVAIAGGFTPRARRNSIELARRDDEGVARVRVPMTTVIRPGDTVFVHERWF